MKQKTFITIFSFVFIGLVITAYGKNTSEKSMRFDGKTVKDFYAKFGDKVESVHMHLGKTIDYWGVKGESRRKAWQARLRDTYFLSLKFKDGSQGMLRFDANLGEMGKFLQFTDPVRVNYEGRTPSIVWLKSKRQERQMATREKVSAIQLRNHEQTFKMLSHYSLSDTWSIQSKDFFQATLKAPIGKLGLDFSQVKPIRIQSGGRAKTKPSTPGLKPNHKPNSGSYIERIRNIGPQPTGRPRSTLPRRR